MAVTAKQMVLARRACQTLSVLLLCYIIWSTRYPLSGFINPAFYFYMDPFAMIITSIAERVLLTGLVSAAAMLVLSYAIGRAFCGWICPLGALLDLLSWAASPVRRLFRKKHREPEPSRLRLGKYAILLAIFLFALAGVQTAWVLDPITIFVRTFSFNIHPFINGAIDSGFNRVLGATGYPEWLEAFYDRLRELFLGIATPEFSHAGVIFGIFAAILVLSLVRRRFWCRYLCPLGATLALPAGSSPFRRSAERCTANCGICKNTCRMNAIRGDNSYIPGECVLCLDCLVDCPGEKATFSFRKGRDRAVSRGQENEKRGQSMAEEIVIAIVPGSEQASSDSYRHCSGARVKPGNVQGIISGKKPVLTRSQFLATAIGSIVIASGPLSAAPAQKKGRPGTAAGLRPPGALPEEDFISRCIRCGNCMKVCPTNLLQPSSIAGRPGAAWSPVLDTRRGYCEYGCNLCGQVCPTDAIRELTLGQKQKFQIGIAVFDKKICLPYAKGENCIVCEEHCPVPEKAIRVKEAVVKGKRVMQPYVVRDLCIGCAICELKCPVEPDKAIVVKKARDAGGSPAGPGIKPAS
ncbi:MAG TPA: 4Fe-4S binding protein [Spirochaetota bacterium]|nr:4Fe-4S binding protein [Spirochaetota bacterium]